MAYAAIIALVVGVAVLIGIFVTTAKLWIKVPNNKAILIYGRKNKRIDSKTGIAEIKTGRIISHGGGDYKIPYFEKVQSVDLTIMRITLHAEDLPSKEYVRVDIDAVAMVRVIDSEKGIRTALKSFGDFTGQEENIKHDLHQILLGQVRDTISTLTPQQIHSDREKVQQQILEASADSLAQFGMELATFTIQGVSDKIGFLEELSKESEAKVNRDVEIEASISDRERQVRIMENDIAVIEAEQEKALAEQEKINIIKQKEIEIEQSEDRLQEVKNKVKTWEYELQKIKITKEAEARAETRKIISQAEADANLIVSKAEAEAIQLVGFAEAESKRALAGAYEKLDEKAKLLFIMDKLPLLFETILQNDQIANIVAEAAKPLSSIESVKMYDFGGGDNNGNPLQKFADTAPKFLINLISKAKELGLVDLLNKANLNSDMLEEE